MPSEKRIQVKRLYFDPREPATILPITDKLREKYPNVSKKNVTEILRSLETTRSTSRGGNPRRLWGK